MKVVEVTNQQLEKEFLLLPVKLYQSENNWIRPLDKDIKAVFNQKKNKAFQHGECIRWILVDGDKTIGRVAAFVNTKTATKGNDQPTGGIGFFDCIHDQKAAFMLFDQCKEWLQQRGMEAMDGPINFGGRDRWWGLLIEGFEREPNYQCNYNFPYYEELFRTYGFQSYFYQLTFGRSMLGALDQSIQEKAHIIERDSNYRFAYLPKSDKTLADKIRYVYNKAWANRGEMSELSVEQAHHLVKQMRPVIDEKLVWFAYYKDEPVAFFISLPEVNQIFKYFNGKLGWIEKLKFVWHTFQKTNRKAFGILFGIVPEHQGKHVDAGLIENFRRMAQADNFQYTEYEMNWIGDFNPKMIRVAEKVTPNIVKKHVTLRKLFDPTKPFNRAPILNG
jgi:hypothetical protein